MDPRAPRLWRECAADDGLTPAMLAAAAGCPAGLPMPMPGEPTSLEAAPAAEGSTKAAAGGASPQNAARAKPGPGDGAAAPAGSWQLEASLACLFASLACRALLSNAPLGPLAAAHVPALAALLSPRARRW